MKQNTLQTARAIAFTPVSSKDALRSEAAIRIFQYLPKATIIEQTRSLSKISSPFSVEDILSAGL